MKFLTSISCWLYRLIHPHIWTASLVLFILFLFIVLPHEAQRSSSATGTDASPDTSFFYTPEELYDLAEAYGPDGRAYYISSRFSFDVIWPISYLLFLTCSITLVFRGLETTGWMRLTNLLPFFGFLLDLMENSAASLVMFRFPDTSPAVALLAPWCTLLKWICIAASFAVLAVGAGMHVRRVIVKRSR